MISVRNLRKTYQMGDVEVQALQDVSFDIRQGEFVSIMGPSGSGKSTLMNLLGCLDTPTSGSYLLDGVEVAQLTANDLSLVRAQKLGFIFQQYNLLPRQSALRNVEMPMIYRGVPAGERRRRATIALKIVGMGSRIEHRPNELSGGQQQRVAIARALVGSPAVVLADEPTGALDTKTSVEIMAILQRLNQAQGLTVILVTHEPDVAAYANRVLHVRDGLLISDGPPARDAGSDLQPALGLGPQAERDGVRRNRLNLVATSPGGGRWCGRSKWSDERIG
ncbi:MAG: ABC transporter ATP-binding protein [Herpetosiphonaceae bacterium]|nr:ABC transporter ATP-binding protein [Herpetosiphonaceae bacterium]